MKHTLLALALTAGPALAQTCPQPPDRSGESDALIARMQEAPSASEGRVLSNQLWAIWATAPDATAQEMLDAGMARRESYDYEGAMVHFDALVSYCPDYAEGYNQRAFFSYLRGEYGLALTDLERALERNPRHVAAMSGMALTLMGLGRIKAAQSVLRDALLLNPWLPERAYLLDPPGKDI